MSKLTWKDLERKDIAIHTPSKELMVKVANIIADKYNDITYEQNKIKSERDGRSYSDAYYAYEEDTCVELTHNELTHNEWHFADKEYFLYNDYEVVEYEDVKHLFESERTVKPNQIYRHFKKGDYYATLGVSKPIDEEEFASVMSKTGLDESIKTHYVYHTELERQLIVIQKDGELYHRGHNSEDELVIYVPLYFSNYDMYARPKDMFLSPVDQDKYKNATQKYRMELVK